MYYMMQNYLVHILCVCVCVCVYVHVLQGTDHLTVTWKVEEGILHHIDILEQGKPNQFSLGKSLWIGTDVRAVVDANCQL